MSKIKKLGICPECGSETVVEKVPYGMGVNRIIRTERCDGLIEIHPDKPLEACMWSQELEMITPKSKKLKL